MRNNYILLTIIALLGIVEMEGQTKFQRLYTYFEGNQAHDVCATSDGGFAYIGIVDSFNIVDSLDGPQEVAVTKIDCNGEVQWAKRIGISGTWNNVFQGIIEAENGDIVSVGNIGGFNAYDIVLTRFESGTGDMIWNKIFRGNRNDTGRGLIQLADGSFVIGGGTGSYGTESSSSFTDLYIYKVDGDGNLIWSKTYGNASNIDAIYELTSDPNGNILATGRYLVGGTFYAFIMRLDPIDGSMTLFKSFGYENQRTYGYGIVAGDDFYAITGSTTIAKEDHTSSPDVFLIKTDLNGDIIFSNIYIPVLGGDRSESGSSLVITNEGGFAIGVPTMSFTLYSSGFVPNKNAAFITDGDGNITKAFIYNQGGSHYTRLNPGKDKGYVISGFSTFFTTLTFSPLLIKTNSEWNSGCNEIEVTGEVGILNEEWDTQAPPFIEDSGDQVLNSNFGSPFVYDGVNDQCSDFPDVASDFSSAGACSGEPVFFTDSSLGGVVEWTWDFGDGETSDEQNPEHIYTEGGVYSVMLTVTDGCKSSSFEVDVIIESAEINMVNDTICPGESVFLEGAEQTETGTYIDTITGQTCNGLMITNLVVQDEVTMQEVFDTICSGESILIGGEQISEPGNYTETVQGNFCTVEIVHQVSVIDNTCNFVLPNAFIPGNNGPNSDYKLVTDCSLTSFSKFQINIFNRWGELVFESNDGNFAWDGKCDGKACPQDIYVATVKYISSEDCRPTEKTINGDVLLIR